MSHIQVGFGCTDDGSKVTLVLALHFLKSDHSRGFLVNDSAETSFAFHDDIRNTHLATEGGQEDDELDGVDIMSDDDKSSLLSLDEGNYMIKTVFDE